MSNNHRSQSTSNSDGIRVYAPLSANSKDVDENNKSTRNDGIRVYDSSSDAAASSSSFSMFDNRFFKTDAYNFSEIVKFVSYIINKNKLRNKGLSHKKYVHKLEVAKKNNNIDLYSDETIDPQDSNYEVDHIFEIQCFAYIIAAALHQFDGSDHGRAIFEELNETLIDVINSPANLNVTHKKTNLIKMNVVKVFIKMRWIDSSLKLADCLRKSNYNKSIDLFCERLKFSSKSIRHKIETSLNEAKITGLSRNIRAWMRILEEFDIFYNSMKID